jgi:hypothetical protein
VALDLRKAFNCVCRTLFVQKLKKAGIDPEWFINYLSGRLQCLKNNDNLTYDYLNDIYGVLQGSVLGPILLSVFINDMLDVLKTCLAFMFAGDTTLLLTGDPQKIQITIDLIEKDIELINQWQQNRLQLNAAKTYCIVLRSPSNVKKVGEICIKVQDSKITSKDSVKILSFHIDNKLTWATQIKSLTRRCYAQLRPLRMLQPQVSQQSMLLLVNSFVLSNLNSMVAVWGSADKMYLKSVEKVVKTAARLVLSKKSADSISRDISETLRWLNAFVPIQKTLLTMMYK